LDQERVLVERSRWIRVGF